SSYFSLSFCFFFSSRRRHTRSKRDWSSDVCSSDLYPSKIDPKHVEALKKIVGDDFVTTEDYPRLAVAYGCTGYDLLRLRHKQIRSEERRVGKEGRARWSQPPQQENAKSERGRHAQ